LQAGAGHWELLQGTVLRWSTAGCDFAGGQRLRRD
jgi:hypothetical protein